MVEKVVLLSFKLNDNKPIESCDLQFYDKVDTKFTGWTEEQFKAAGVRVVPPAVARKGSFQAKGVILMPSYVNIGAYVDEGNMALIHGQLWVHVLKLVKMYTCQAVGIWWCS